MLTQQQVRIYQIFFILTPLNTASHKKRNPQHHSVYISIHPHILSSLHKYFFLLKQHIFLQIQEKSISIYNILHIFKIKYPMSKIIPIFTNISGKKIKIYILQLTLSCRELDYWFSFENTLNQAFPSLNYSFDLRHPPTKK